MLFEEVWWSSLGVGRVASSIVRLSQILFSSWLLERSMCYSKAFWYEIVLMINFTMLQAESAAHVSRTEELNIACSPMLCLTLQLDSNSK